MGMSKPKEQHAPSAQKWHFSQMGLTGALLIAVAAACFIVALAYYMYLQNPNRKYDLARPGSSDDQSLRVNDEADTTGPVSADSAQKKIEYLEKEIDALGGVNAFELDDLSDQNIQLTPGEESSY
jgi:hypothetical protein